MNTNPFTRFSVSLLLAAAASTAVHAGSVARLIYDGITGSTVASLTNAAIFPNGPTFREQLDDFTPDSFGNPVFGLQGKDNSFVDFGSWIRGYLEAPTTGNYVFYIAGDDSSELRLSTNHVATNAVRIAFDSGSGAPLFSGPRLNERQSARIPLTRGEKYYFEVLHKQDGGASYIQVGWQRPEGTQEIIPALHLAQHPLDPFLGRTDANAAPFFNTSGLNGGDLPATATVSELGPLLLQVDVIAAQPTTFQWLSNAVPIAGENLSFLRWAAVPLSADGAAIQVVVSNEFGTLTSGAATLTVTPDATPLGVQLVDHRGNPNGVRVTFTKTVNPSTATNLANYSLRPVGAADLPIASATLLGDQTSVQLGGAFNFQLGAHYQLTIQKVEDTASIPNGLSPDPTSILFTFAGEVGPVGFATNNPLADVTVLENRLAHFEVIPTGVPPFTYQWVHEGAPIAEATNRVLDLLAVFSAAGNYQVVVSNEFSSATSASVRLTVQPDLVPPRLRAVRGLAGGLNEAQLAFDEPVDAATATRLATYSLGLVPVISATLSSDGANVTLRTGNLVRGQIYLLTISGLKDRAVAANALSTTAAFVAEVNYVGEVLADGPVRYWRFDETNGSYSVASLAAVRDALTNAVGTLAGSPTLGVASLVPNEPSDSAIQFVATNSQRIAVPNGSDLNASAGPWAKKSFEVWFRATSVPAPGTTGLGATAALWEQGAATRGIALYLWRDPANSNPDEAALVLHAFNNASDGAGAPFGPPGNPAVFAQAPIQAGQSYQAVGVLDGDATGTNGTVILYLNGVEVARAGGAGQIYNHTGDVQIGHGNGRIHSGESGNLGYFDGVIDDLSVYNAALPASRVAAHYRAGASSPQAGVIAPAVAPVDTRGNPNQILVTFNKPVSAATANHLANFSLQHTSGTVLPIFSASLLADERTVWLQGNFGFQVGANYVLTVSNITDQAVPPNTLAPSLTNVNFSFTAPAASFYDFNARLPDGVQVFGAAGVTPSGGYDGSGYLQLTDATNGQTGVALFAERRDVDQFHLRFKARFSDPSSPPADGFSVTLAADLPSGTFGTAEEGYLPLASLNADRLIVAFDNYANSSADYSPSIAVKWRGLEIINVLAGTNGVPALENTSGAWGNVDIQLRRGGKITVVYDRVTVVNQLPTGFDLLPNAQLALAARTGGFFETHWFDDVSLNFAENDIGPVGIGADSELANVLAYENQLVRFTVVPTGAGPFAYQWYRYGTPILGGNTPVLNVVATTNVTGHYYAVVRNEFSQATSPQATLSVDTDVTPPTVERLVALAGPLNEIRVWFDEPLDGVTATNLANYSAGPLSLLSATLSPNGREVILKTGQQVFQQSYTLQISGVKDRSASGNVLNAQAPFVSTVSYPDEVLADQPVRYWRFDETNGNSVASLTSVLDVLATTSGTLVNSPVLGQPSLVPNTIGDGAIRFVAANSNCVTVPNGADLNITSGPWAKRSIELWFNAASVPTLGSTGLNAATALWEEGAATRGLAVYLWRDPANSAPAQAELVFHAWNNAADGPGSPFGATNAPPIYVHTTISTGLTYHVVAVLDGDTNITGQILLYVNGVETGRQGGVGQIYNHSADIQIARGNTLIHTRTTAGKLAYFDGTLDEFSVYNQALAADRVATHYQVGTTSVAPPVINSITVESGNIVI